MSTRVPSQSTRTPARPAVTRRRAAAASGESSDVALRDHASSIAAVMRRSTSMSARAPKITLPPASGSASSRPGDQLVLGDLLVPRVRLDVHVVEAACILANSEPLERRRVPRHRRHRSHLEHREVPDAGRSPAAMQPDHRHQVARREGRRRQQLPVRAIRRIETERFHRRCEELGVHRRRRSFAVLVVLDRDGRGLGPTAQSRDHPGVRIRFLALILGAVHAELAHVLATAALPRGSRRATDRPPAPARGARARRPRPRSREVLRSHRTAAVRTRARGLVSDRGDPATTPTGRRPRRTTRSGARSSTSARVARHRHRAGRSPSQARGRAPRPEGGCSASMTASLIGPRGCGSRGRTSMFIEPPLVHASRSRGGAAGAPARCA